MFGIRIRSSSQRSDHQGLAIIVGMRMFARHRQNEHEKTVLSGEFELTGELSLPERPATSRGMPYDEARLLVRVRGEPVGFVTVPLGREHLTRDAIVHAVRRDLDAAIAELDKPSSPGSVSIDSSGSTDASASERGTEQSVPVSVAVVVCTRNRADSLKECLNALARIVHHDLAFIIVDNAPLDDTTLDVVMALASHDPRFQYVREPIAGLSRARNRGLAHVTSEVIAYTDDDVRVDSLWVKGLLRGFGRRPDVACVTGLVASASLELPVEQYFDGRVGWSSSCKPGVYDARHGPVASALHPYAAGAFGTGANFAASRGLLLEIGGFDESLGVGSPCAGGEDFDIFVRFIRAGYAIAYEPAALVWHEHRSDRDGLTHQMYGYGKSLSAYLFKYASSRQTAFDMLSRLPQGVRHLGGLGARSSRMGTQTGLAHGPVIAEMRGLAAGPFAYIRARRAQDTERRRAVAP
jgi:GT2 family glycosyltransferase